MAVHKVNKIAFTSIIVTFFLDLDALSPVSYRNRCRPLRPRSGRSLAGDGLDAISYDAQQQQTQQQQR